MSVDPDDFNDSWKRAFELYEKAFQDPSAMAMCDEDPKKKQAQEVGNQWISIKDEKPPEHVWIIGGNPQRVEFGIWQGDKKGFCLPDLNYLCLHITHWMHLPLPPKKEKR